MWHNAIYDLTPVENIGDVWFKREDEFTPDGVHNGSKFRQLIWLFSRAKFPGVVSGAVTGSPQLPMVAACAQHYKMKCIQFSGARKNMVSAGEKLGAKTMLVIPGYGPLLNKRARDYAEERGWLHIETNITESKDVEPFHRIGAEQVRNIPDHIETLMVPAGSRNSLTSILYGLSLFPPKNLQRVILLNIAPNIVKKQKWMTERLAQCGVGKIGYDIKTYDVFANGYTNYHRLMLFAYNGLRFHPRYEGKCWNYIKDNLSIFLPYINDKTLFWIVGSEPRPCVAQYVPQIEAPLSLQASSQARF
jgi:hypothetical protein